MKRWFKENLAGPLSMFFIASLGAGVFTLVSIALANQSELRLITQFMRHSLENDSKHDVVDNKLAEAMRQLVKVQTEFRIEMSNNKTRDSIVRRDLDEVRSDFKVVHR